MADFKVSNEKERLLCYAAGILGARLSNSNNTYDAKALINASIRHANELINRIYDDKKLQEILDGAP